MDEKIEAELDWNLASAEVAYGIIARYVEHSQISGMIIALLANMVGEEQLKTLTQSEYWQSYIASKHTLTEAKNDIEQLTMLIDRIHNQTKTVSEE